MSSAAGRLAGDLKEIVGEQFEFRELLYQMTRRDLLLRYKQTIMGFGWAVFMPLLNTAVFSVIFTRVAPIETPVPYPLYAYCGLWAWNLFASSLKFSVNSLTSNTNLVTKVYFPREIFPFSAVIVALVDSVVAASVLVALMIWYGVAPTASAMVWLPAVIAAHLAFTAGVGLLLSLANLFYRDVKYLFEILLTVWMFMTSVLYPLDALDGLFATLMRFNPMTPIIDGYRVALLGVPMRDPAGFVIATAVAFGDMNPLTSADSPRYQEYIDAVSQQRSFADRLRQYGSFVPLLLRGALITLEISAAAMAVAIVWRGGAPFALLKPSHFPFAFFGIRQRSWWIGLAAFVGLCIPFGALWGDWLTSVVNSRGAGPLYSALEAPMLALPLVAWIGRRRR